MRRNKPFIAILILATGLVLNGCGSSFQSGPEGGTFTFQSGSLAVFGTDAPLCDVYSFQVTLTGATLTPAGGGSDVAVITSSNPVTVDFARLVDFANLLKLSNVPVGRYSAMTLTLSNPVLMVLDVTQNPPAPLLVQNTSLSVSTVTVNLRPALEVTQGKASGLMIDFSLLKSVETDANGQLTGLVAPVFQAGMTVPSERDGVGRAQEMRGIVRSVSTTSINTAFTGSFTMQVHGGVGPIFTINTTSNTRYEGLTGLADLAASDFVEVDAMVDTGGAILAKEVERQGDEPLSSQRAAVLGRVVSVTRDGAGAATEFVIVVREVYPDLTQSIPLGSPLTIYLQPTTLFGIVRPAINEAQLTFDAKSLGVGESVAVRGLVQPGPPITVDARGVFVKPRTVLGNFNTLLADSGDGRTGGFSLTPCGSLFAAQPVTVLTFNDTEFSGVSGLAALDPKPLVGVRGLLFYQQDSGISNGAAWTAPAWVLEANRVRQHAP
jgi:Domain of unknown function (DUF4382)/Domain of unknown function (DUF5666)